MFLVACAAVLIGGCDSAPRLSRQELVEFFPKLCAKKFQARVTCKEAGDTLWIYLPYTPGRKGFSVTETKGTELTVTYSIASFNPYREFEPAELRFVSQAILRQARELLLRAREPYAFFVMVMTDIEQKSPQVQDQCYLGSMGDVRTQQVGAIFSGEPYNRLVWYPEKVAAVQDSLGNKIASSYGDVNGAHLAVHDVTLKEFVEKQINWRIYKRFTIEYNTVPFDITASEKRAEVLNIIQAVLKAYNFKEFASFRLGDGSFLDGVDTYLTSSREQVEYRNVPGTSRRPAF